MKNVLAPSHVFALIAAGAITQLCWIPDSHAQDQDWQQDLADQIEAVEDCVIESFGDAVEEQVDDQTKLSVVVECKDGRLFRATQPDKFLPFAYEACETNDSAAC